MTVGRVVIAGAGQAGFQTAASLRQLGFQGGIALIGDECEIPYQRPPLSKAYLLGKTSADAISFRPQKFFAEHDIELISRTAITAIDRGNRRVALIKGGAVAYEHLVLALGARNRALPVPGANLNGVFALRTLADADALAKRLADAQNVIVAGAGFIGLEFAAVASSLGKSVHVFDIAERALARVLSIEMSGLLAGAQESWNVKLHFGQGIARIEDKGGRVVAVETTEGQKRAADLVVFGIGVVPNTAIAAEAGLDVENGIRVDQYLLTSDPAISAVGDCASFPRGEGGEYIRLESVQNAVDQGRAAAARIVGRPVPFDTVPWFWSDQRDLKLQIAGLSVGTEQTVCVGDAASRRMSVLCFKQGRLIAVESVNRGSDHVAARKILARKASMLTLAEAKSDGFDLKAWEAVNGTRGA